MMLLQADLNSFASFAGFFDVNHTEQLRLCLNASLELHEIENELRPRGADVAAHLPPLRLWIHGAPYRDILDAGITSQLFEGDSDVRVAVRYCSSVSMWLSWAFGACFAVLQSLVT